MSKILNTTILNPLEISTQTHKFKGSFYFEILNLKYVSIELLHQIRS